MSPQPTAIAWIDLETTDTNPRSQYAQILEIGMIITLWDVELTEVARASLLIRPAGGGDHRDKMWASMHPFVKDMHTANGLWVDATTSRSAWDLTQADRELTGWMIQHAGEDPVPLAGSGVGHLDLPFVKAWMPMLSGRLTYWPLDVGHVRRLLELAGRDDLVDLETDVHAKPHRALPDVELHVAEARRYLSLLGRIPALEPAGVMNGTDSGEPSPPTE